jgi:hypothetical protein
VSRVCSVRQVCGVTFQSALDYALVTLASSLPAQVLRTWSSINRLCPTPTPKDPSGVFARACEYAPSQLDSQGGCVQSPAQDCQGEYSHLELAIVKVGVLRHELKRQDERMYHQFATIQVNVLHHRRAAVKEVCPSTSSRQQR